MAKKAKDTAKALSAPKRVVYLWGAGATQGEISYSGAAGLNLGMQDSDLGEGIASRIMQRLEAKWQTAFLSDKGIDIEKLISLLAASAIGKYEDLATKLRKLYFEDICTVLSTAKIASAPTLAMSLLEFHQIDHLKAQEILTGIITTNHDGLLQVAAQNVYGSVNLGMPFDSADLIVATGEVPPILQLHGSFTWAFGLPIKVTPIGEDHKYSVDAIWIPPAILKESKSYPFNKLAGLGYELLSKQCDVLRVVGSSMTQNDWNILSMIFNAQRHRERLRESPFRIELIVPPAAGDEISRNCSYLRNLVPIGQLTDGDFEGYREEGGFLSEDMKNPVFYWLREKISYHQRRGDFGESPIGQEVRELLEV